MLDSPYSGGMSFETVSRRIPAPAQALFDIVADPAMHPVTDGSGSVRRAAPGNPERLGPGATFGMGMRIGASYRTKSRVTEFDDGHRIAWQVGSGGAIWRYTFESDGDDTIVTEQWDVRHMPIRGLIVAAGFGRRARRGMSATLHRLQELTTQR